MPGTLRALLVGVFSMTLGHGLLNVLLGVRAGLEGMSELAVGLMMSAYFLGFVTGTSSSQRIVERVGHIRAFSAGAACCAAIVLAHAIVINQFAWGIFRILYGVSYGGLCVVAESWIGQSAPGEKRGRTLGLYLFLVWSAWAVSQLMLNLASPKEVTLFLVVAIFLCLALVPLSLSTSAQVVAVPSTAFSFRSLFSISPFGASGTFVAGFCVCSFLGLGAVFAQTRGLALDDISYSMSGGIAGGLLFQWPLGWLSDRMDRRLVIMGMALFGALVSAGLALSIGGTSAVPWLVTAYGACSFPMYSICVADVNDRVLESERLAASAGLLFLYGVGGAVGPLVGGVLMEALGGAGLFAGVAVSMAVLATYAGYRVFQISPEALAPLKKAFVALPRTTPMVLLLRRPRKR